MYIDFKSRYAQENMSEYHKASFFRNSELEQKQPSLPRRRSESPLYKENKEENYPLFKCPYFLAKIFSKIKKERES